MYINIHRNIGKSVRLERIFNRAKRDMLEMGYHSIQDGGRGVAIGRNVFQADDLTALMQRISKVGHQGLSMNEVYE